MVLQQRILLVVVVFFYTLLDSAVQGSRKEKLEGDSCFKFNECGDYPRSFLQCHKHVCQCAKLMYYEESMSMCVSFVGGRCDVSEPTDDIKLMIKCGQNAECVPHYEDKFGRCRCLPGHKVTEEKCVQINQIISSRVQGSHPIHPNHPKYGESGSGGGAVDGNGNYQQYAQRDNEFVSFPFGSSDARTGRNSQNPLKSQLLTIILPLIFCLLLHEHWL